MNFLCKLTNFRIFFFIIILSTNYYFSAFPSHYQEFGLPYIRNIRPFSFTGVDKYHSFTQDKNGFIYLGGFNGVLKYDGSHWKQLNIPGQIVLASDKTGKVYAGGDNIFGTIDYLTDGSLHLTNLLPGIKQDKEIGVIRKIFLLKKYVVLYSSTNIFIWNEKLLDSIDLPEMPECITQNGDSLFLYSRNSGLCLMFDERIVSVTNDKILNESTVQDMIFLGDTLLISTRENGFLYLFHDSIKSFTGNINCIIGKKEIVNMITDINGSLIFATINGEIIIYDPKKKTCTILNQNSGLPGSQINQLYSDKSGKLWILYNDIITCIEWPSYYSYFDSRNGLSGEIRSIIRFNDKIYCSSSAGIYVLEIPNDSENLCQSSSFKKITDEDFNCGKFLSTGKNLLVTSQNGILQVNESSATLIFRGDVHILFQSVSHPEFVLAGTSQGVIALSESYHKWIFSPVASNISFSVHDIIESDQGYLWISTAYSGLYGISISEGLPTESEYYRYSTTDGLPSDYEDPNMIHAFDKIIFSTSDGLYYFNTSEKRFFPYSGIKSLTHLNQETIVLPIFEDHDNNLWLKSFIPESNETFIWKAAFSGPDKYDLIPFNFRCRDNLVINSVYPDPNGEIWILCQNLLLRIDSTSFKEKAQDFQPFISKITVDKDFIILPSLQATPANDRQIQKLLKIPYHKDNVRFDFVSTDLISERNEQYHFMLKGFDQTWSEWQSENHIEFINIPPGKYTFLVSCRNFTGHISQTDQFSFRIKPPFYFSWLAFIFYLICLLSGLFIFRKWKTFKNLQERYKLEDIIQERTEALIKEKEKSENLLANILPKNTADELKLTGKATSSKFNMATVLFADIQGFTKIAEHMNPEKLIDELDKFYFHFDTVVEKYNIEKIKTIGDAYMAAGGIPIKNRTNPVEVVLAALEMQQYMKELKSTKTDFWDLRIGIHTGSVIAGVVGQKKYSYDIWGDTVNTASRMESSGEPGKVNISATTYELVKDFFNCSYRGKMPVKYKGDIEMYFAQGLKTELQNNNEVTPNEEFEIKLQMLRLLDLEEFILQKLENEIPKTFYFHDLNHTSHVNAQVELLGRSENVSVSDLLLLRSAAILHDIGYIENFEDHEIRSVELTRQILPLYRYKEDQIDQICKLILATRMPPEPKNLLEKIICDANLDHLGRVDFLIQSDKLFQEYRSLGKIESKKEWNEFQINFLRNHEFFTTAARELREVSKEEQIQNIKQFS